MRRRILTISLIALVAFGVAGARLLHEHAVHRGGAAHVDCGAKGRLHACHAFADAPSHPAGNDGAPSSCPTCELLAIAMGAAPSSEPPTVVVAVVEVGLHDHVLEQVRVLPAPTFVRARPPPIG